MARPSESNRGIETHIPFRGDGDDRYRCRATEKCIASSELDGRPILASRLLCVRFELNHDVVRADRLFWIAGLAAIGFKPIDQSLSFAPAKLERVPIRLNHPSSPVMPAFVAGIPPHVVRYERNTR